MKELDVLCVGLCCIDVLIRGVDLSTPFDAESKHADSTTLSVGGDALNEARVLARLGDRVALQCAVGRDVGAQLIRSAVAESGADIHGITAEMDATPMNVVVIQPDGQRNFINTGLLSYGDYDPGGVAGQPDGAAAAPARAGRAHRAAGQRGRRAGLCRLRRPLRRLAAAGFCRRALPTGLYLP